MCEKRAGLGRDGDDHKGLSMLDSNKDTLRVGDIVEYWVVHEDLKVESNRMVRW